MKNASAEYSKPLCEIVTLESQGAFLEASAGSTINDWITDPEEINL